MPSALSALNLPTPTNLSNASSVITRIGKRVIAASTNSNPSYLPSEFEDDLNKALSALLPRCVLASIKLYSPSFLADFQPYGLEVDNLLHLRKDGIDHLILIEAKKQLVSVDGEKWLAQYEGTEDKDVLRQVGNHIKALKEYLSPISRDIELKFRCLVVTSDEKQEQASQTIYLNTQASLLSFRKLVPALMKEFDLELGSNTEPFRISQSPFLDLLRLGTANPHLGHPEISGAIRFVERCRRELDQSLFEFFTPTEERWLINGSAGMGKSVLLAYSAAVLSSGHHLRKFHGEIGTYRATEILDKIGYNSSNTNGRIAIAANSRKQLDSLHMWFDYFVHRFQHYDQAGHVNFKRPEFILFRDLQVLRQKSQSWTAVFIDEAHDLLDHTANDLKIAYDENEFYLVAACDRHQRLQSDSDATAIKGFSFSLKSRRLRYNYRNPSSIYIASLALMFRWFAADGPKVIPTKEILKDNFGFEIIQLPGQPMLLSLKNDTHPANGWHHNVGRYENASTVYTLLNREKLSRSDVLWVRFCPEDPDFDYEQVQHEFTYHNCRTDAREARELNDKYIKGQDYPVVVIEGFPGFMDQYDTETAENRMWQFRRELYLCASRATCFLFFVCNVKEDKEISNINKELNDLVTSCSSPDPANEDTAGTRNWKLRIKETGVRRTMKDFSDMENSDIVEISSYPSNSTDSTIVNTTQESTNSKFGHINTSESPATPDVPDIAGSYENWPLDEEELPYYEYVIHVEEELTPKELSNITGVALPQIFRELRERNLPLGTNQKIPLPYIRSIGLAHNCYIADEETDYHRANGSLITWHSSMTLRDFANEIQLDPHKLMDPLFEIGEHLSPRDHIKFECAQMLAKEYGYLVISD